jgi:hypothetical protein
MNDDASNLPCETDNAAAGLVVWPGDGARIRSSPDPDPVTNILGQARPADPLYPIAIVSEADNSDRTSQWYRVRTPTYVSFEIACAYVAVRATRKLDLTPLNIRFRTKNPRTNLRSLPSTKNVSLGYAAAREMNATAIVEDIDRFKLGSGAIRRWYLVTEPAPGFVAVDVTNEIGRQ